MFKEKIKEMIDKNKEKDSKKKIESLVVFLIVLITTIIAINAIWKEDKNKENNLVYEEVQLATKENNIIEDSLEEKLKKILSKINGIEDIEVLIAYSESNKTVAMYNENKKESSTQEQDLSGGTRTIQESDIQKEIIYKEENGEKIPITEKIIMAEIEGAIIIAKGINLTTIKPNIIQAVEAVTGLHTHKIQILEMK